MITARAVLGRDGSAESSAPPTRGRRGSGLMMFGRRSAKSNAPPTRGWRGRTRRWGGRRSALSIAPPTRGREVGGGRLSIAGKLTKRATAELVSAEPTIVHYQPHAYFGQAPAELASAEPMIV